MQAEPIRFFISCDAVARYFYVVEFYNTPAQMRKAVVKLSGKSPRGLHHLQACCLRYVFDPKTVSKEERQIVRTSEPLGTLFFVHGDASLYVVLHELTHAAVGWARRAGVNPLRRAERYSRCPEEKFANVLSRLAKEFYINAPRALET